MEYGNLFNIEKINSKINFLLGVIFLIFKYFNPYNNSIVLFFCAVILLNFFAFATQKKIPDYTKTSLLVCGLVYVFFPIGCLLSIFKITNIYYVIIIFLITWSTDIGGYLGGHFFGKTKVFTKLSPNKSLEGLIFSTILCLIFTLSLWNVGANHNFLIKLSTSKLIILALIISLIAPLGDLFESSLKRYAQIKDTSSLFPGHGGILDRADSLFFTIVFFYYFLMYGM